MPDFSLEFQREVARVALEAAQGEGFALAGSGAIREHGLIHRPTQDVDLFTVQRGDDPGAFRRGVVAAGQAWEAAGYEVVTARANDQFATFIVSAEDGRSVEVDMGVDWRGADPVKMGVGPVLSLEDAIGNKVSALYSRAAPRDYLDVDAIRGAGVLTDDELLVSARERDPGFEPEMFAAQLDQGRFIPADQVEEYGVSAEEWSEVQGRCRRWAQQITSPQPQGGLETVRERQRAAFPQSPSATAQQSHMDTGESQGKGPQLPSQVREVGGYER